MDIFFAQHGMVEGRRENTPILHSPRDLPSPCAIAGAYARMRQRPHLLPF